MQSGNDVEWQIQAEQVLKLMLLGTIQASDATDAEKAEKLWKSPWDYNKPKP